MLLIFAEQLHYTNLNYITVTALGNPTIFGGNSAFIVPPGVSCIQVEVWGGGGKASTGTADGEYGGGGGGAFTPEAYCRVFLGKTMMYSWVLVVRQLHKVETQDLDCNLPELILSGLLVVQV